MQEIRLSGSCLYEGKILRLHRDTVQLENGRQAVREVISHSGAAAVLALDDADNVLLVRQFRYPFAAELTEIPAGKLDPGEDPAVCAQRELEEEAGYRANRLVPLTVLYPSPAYLTERIYLYLATDLVPTAQHLDEGEFLTVQKLPFAQALALALDGQLPDAKTQIALLHYAARRAADQ